MNKKRYRPRFIDNTYRPDAKVGRFLSALIFFGVSYGLYRGIQDNYLAEIIHITPFERGIVEFFREIPGLLVILILALMYRFADSKIFKIGVAIMAGGSVGLFLTSASPVFMTKIFVVIFMVIFSAGEHTIMPVRATIAMDLAKKEKTGASLGLSNSISQFGNIAGFIFVMVLFFFLGKIDFKRTDVFGYRIVFGASAALIITSALIASALRETTLKPQRRRFYFAKKFKKFYMLEIFYGARKQIFLTFAPYVLILQYGADPSIMSILYAICAGFGMFCSPLIGRIIDKVGYKAVMVADTLILIVVCILYGFAHRVFPHNIAFLVVCCNFILDSIISIASMASNIYVQRIASNQEEITATLSTGISVNHIISIFIALMGGWIWKVTGIEVLFSLSAFLGLLNSIYAATIKKDEELTAD
ncbi:MAG: MFS transporter [Treponema sp.]|jgi:MFS family permease|nr:MFS transporter [Treponema sp.]